MLIMELESKDVATPYYDASEDDYNTRHLTSTRKKKITLKNLNALKKIRSLQALEFAQRTDLFGIMYGTPEDSAGPAGF